MRVRVFVGRSSVRCPASVPEAECALQWLFIEQVAKPLIDLSFFLVKLEGAVIQNGNTRAVVSAILEPPEAFENNRTGLTFAEITNNSAHLLILSRHCPERPLKCQRQVGLAS